MKRETLKKLVIISMLIALQVVLGRFVSISLPLVKIGFGFIPLTIVAILYGPVWSAAAAGITDILVAVLGPYGYFPPMTISALLSGAIYGLFLYRKPASTKRILLCVLCESILISVLLQTYWLTFLTGKGYMALLSTRIVQNLITIPICVVCIRLISYRVVDLVKKDHGASAA